MTALKGNVVTHCEHKVNKNKQKKQSLDKVVNVTLLVLNVPGNKHKVLRTVQNCSSENQNQSLAVAEVTKR